MIAVNNNTFIVGLFVSLILLSQQLIAADTLFDKRFDRWKKQALQGDKRAQYKLGVAYLRGNEVKVNITESIKWFTKSAKQNYVKAAHKLGHIYYTNKDKRRNYKRGFRWFLKAANKKYAPSQYFIGKMYLEGRGVKRDLERALLWAKRAEKQQLIKAQNLISQIEEAMGSGSKKIASNTKVTPPPKAAPPKAAPVADENTPRPPPKANPPQDPISTLFNTKKVVTAGGWNLSGKPAEHMPSTINKCQESGETIKCITGRVINQEIGYMAHFEVEATFSDFRPTGTYNVKYRKRFIFVLPDDPDDPEPDEDIPALGWQKSHNNLRCRVLARDKMHCFTDDFKVERYTK